jgi:general secretion pathway protein J
MSAQWSNAHGFTLLEMTVVMLLVSLMAVLIMQGLKFGTRAYTRVVKVDDANWEVFVAQQFLRGTLQSTYPFDPERAGNKAYGLEGTATRLSFSAAMGRSAVPGALNRFEIVVAGRDLLIRWRPDRNGRANPAESPSRQDLLVGNIETIEWSYARHSSDAEAMELLWQDTWQGQHELPALIRLKVAFPRGDPRRWPELLVAPRVTDDAMSWFDHP